MKLAIKLVRIFSTLMLCQSVFADDKKEFKCKNQNSSEEYTVIWNQKDDAVYLEQDEDLIQMPFLHLVNNCKVWEINEKVGTTKIQKTFVSNMSYPHMSLTIKKSFPHGLSMHNYHCNFFRDIPTWEQQVNSQFLK